MLKELAEDVLRILKNAAQSGGLGGSGGGGSFLSSLFGSLIGGGGGGAFTGGGVAPSVGTSSFGIGGAQLISLAHGGGLRANQLALVGEKGPELFVPDMSGTIVPNSRLGIGASLPRIPDLPPLAASGGDVVVNIAIDARGADGPGLQAVRAELRQFKREIRGIILGTVSEAHRRRPRFLR